MCRSVTYILRSSYFATYLEDYLMEKGCIWDNGSVWLKDRPSKIYVGQWPIFHCPLIFTLYHFHRLKLFLHIKKWHRPGVFVSLRALALVGFMIHSIRFWDWFSLQPVKIFLEKLSPCLNNDKLILIIMENMHLSVSLSSFYLLTSMEDIRLGLVCETWRL